MIALLLLLMLTIGAVPGHAEDADHDHARDAYRSGEIVSLSSILEEVEKSYDVQVLEVELEREHGKWIYEVELLTPAGNVVELNYDAKTRKLLKIEGSGLEQARRKQ